MWEGVGGGPARREQKAEVREGREHLPTLLDEQDTVLEGSRRDCSLQLRDAGLS